MADSIFVVTNRAFRRLPRSEHYELRDGLNPRGSKELRLFEAEPDASLEFGWGLKLVADRPARRDFERAGVEPPEPRQRRQAGEPGKRPSVRYNGSDLVRARLVRRLRDHGRNLVFFVHGYNNTVFESLQRAQRLKRAYGVEVVVFSWPANGGGSWFLEDLHGLASYRSDKADARSSAEALDRALGRMSLLLGELNQGVLEEARARAGETHPDNPDERRAFMTRWIRENACPFNITLLAHSMGNYLLKKTLMSSDERVSAGMVFDNVILKAADTNQVGHAQWVERLRARRRVYVVVNREDRALALSSMKIGEEQRVRLGNTLRRQDADNATYIDFSGYIGDEHSYFDRSDLSGAPDDGEDLVAFFGAALNGRVGEGHLVYRADTNTYGPESAVSPPEFRGP